ncbi:MAG: AMP-binding protein [Bacteroidota bacterium]
MLQENFVHSLESSIKKNWGLKAFTDYKGSTMYYHDVSKKILELHALFEQFNIQKGDKISLIGKNSSAWTTIYLATITYGAVIVPILPDFNPQDIHNIINHSDSVLLFSSESIYSTLNPEKLPAINGIFTIQDTRPFDNFKKDEINQKLKKAKEYFKENYRDLLSPVNFKVVPTSNEELAVISYTSGTTGFSKGVMLDHNSLMANVRYAWNNMPLEAGDEIVSFLPLAHAYGCAFEFLFPFSLGCHITFLTKTPSPQVIMEAFKEVKPRLILSVPLVIEKIYKKQILPVIHKPHMKFLMKIPGINQIIFNKIRKKLESVFGGNFTEIVIGGAPFNQDAEKFFKKIGFPFTVGYGMTECGPLISYSGWKTTRLRSSGKPVDTLEIKIDSSNPFKEVGEILVKGDNVMRGYYKNEEATKEVIDPEGWLHTGDLGILDKEKNIYIKGRSKSMMLGPSGQNIYPEEIESIINNLPLVQESLVVEKNDKFIALIYPDFELMEKEGVNEEKLNNILKEYKKIVNDQTPSFVRIADFVIYPDEFAKTPKRSIKRFLYTEVD